MKAISKKLLSLAIVLAMVLSMTPVISLPAAAITAEPTTLVEAQEIKKKVDDWAAANQSEFDKGTSFETATCPCCGAENVTWTPVGADKNAANNAVAAGSHAYFSASFDHNQRSLIYSTKDALPTCVYLNNQNINTTGRILASSTVNLFGNGSITKNGTYNASDVFLFSMTNAGSRLHIYGGTYSVDVAGADTVRITNKSAKLFMYGGGLNKTANDTGMAVYVKYDSTFRMFGGTINGPVETASGAAVKLAGNAHINQLTGGTGLTLNGALADISELSATASIDVEGVDSTIIAAARDDAETVKDCFHVDGEGLSVAVNGEKQLYITSGSGEGAGDPVQGIFDPANHGDMAYCEACIAQGVNTEPVQWTAISSAQGSGLAAGHYYLSNDVDLGDATTTFLYAKKNICFNLNGHDLTSNNARIFMATSKLNIMDYTNGEEKADAVVTGGATAEPYYGSAVYASYKNANINIYGGTFTTTATDRPVICINEGGTVNLYGGTIQAANSSTVSGACVQLRGSTSVSSSTNAGPAVFNMHKGTIQGGTSTTGSAVRVGWDENSDATFNMDGGTIQNGKNPNGNGGNVVVSDGQTFNMGGGTIQNGEAARGGNVFVHNAKFNMTGGTIQDGLANDTSSNSSQNHNVYMNNSTMYMSGGSVINSKAGQRGTAIFPGNGSTLILDGSAHVVNAEGISDSTSFPIYMSNSDANILKVTGGWTGKAHMYFLHEDGSAIATGDTTSDKGQSGTYENGAFAKADVEFTGELTAGRNSYRVYSDNAGNLATATAGIVKGSESVYDVTWYKDYAAAEKAYTDGKIIRLFADCTITLTKDNVYVDARNKEISVEGEGNLYAIDTSNDDYDGTGSWTVNSENVNIVRDVTIDGKRYINLTRDDVTTSHRLGLQLTAVSLRPAQSNSNGMYYKATIKCDDVLAAAVDSYGVVLSKLNMPDANFLEGDEADENAWTENEKLSFPEGQNSVTAISGILQGIMKDDLGKDVNRERGERPIYANAYLAIDADGDENPEYYMSNSSDVKYSLFNVLEAIEGGWTDKYTDHQETVAKFYKYLATLGNIESWASKLPQIAAEAAPQA